jgi:hypothetical protein
MEKRNAWRFAHVRFAVPERETAGPFDFAQGRLSLCYPEFPVQFGGVGELHATFFTESRTRGLGWCREAGNPGPLRSYGKPGQAG